MFSFDDEDEDEDEDPEKKRGRWMPAERHPYQAATAAILKIENRESKIKNPKCLHPNSSSWNLMPHGGH
jgi:hypothetical protein